VIPENPGFFPHTQSLGYSELGPRCVSLFVLFKEKRDGREIRIYSARLASPYFWGMTGLGTLILWGQYEQYRTDW
jgi:hypothetical protein